jgi:hypothetical protein
MTKKKRSLPEAFIAKVLADISLSKADRVEANTQHVSLRNALGKLKWVEKNSLSGSYARKTSIRPLNDVDVLLVVKDEGFESPRALLEKLEHAIKDNVPNCTTRIQDHSVNVKFGGSSLGFDIVPAVPEADYYRIPEDSSGTFIATSPDIAKVSAKGLNRSTYGRFSRLICMAKYWNATHGKTHGKTHDKPLKSFHIEVMGYEFARARILGPSHLTNLKEFFLFMTTRVKTDIIPPGPSAAPFFNPSAQQALSAAAVQLQRDGPELLDALEALFPSK